MAMSNNGTGFWVMIGLIAALSFVAVVEAAIALLRIPARYLVIAVKRALRASRSRANERKAAAAAR
jgi:hypothetical protein